MINQKFATSVTCIVLANTIASASAEEWGRFRDDGCIKVNGTKVRQYQSVLWGIPWGQSWEVACQKMPADIKVGGKVVHFQHPNICAKSSIAATLGALSTALGGAGLTVSYSGNPAIGMPISAAAFAMGTITFFVNLGGGGALNMWGIFWVEKVCPA